MGPPILSNKCPLFSQSFLHLRPRQRRERERERSQADLMAKFSRQVKDSFMGLFECVTCCHTGSNKDLTTFSKRRQSRSPQRRPTSQACSYIPYLFCDEIKTMERAFPCQNSHQAKVCQLAMFMKDVQDREFEVEAMAMRGPTRPGVPRGASPQTA